MPSAVPDAEDWRPHPPNDTPTPSTPDIFLARMERLAELWDDIVDQRAREIAQPRIQAAEARAEAAERRAAGAAAHCEERITDLQAEMQRQLTANERFRDREISEFQGLLGSVSLYIKWKYVTKQLTTPQKERFADAVDAWSADLNDGTAAPPALAPRWWRADYRADA